MPKIITPYSAFLSPNNFLNGPKTIQQWKVYQNDPGDINSLPNNCIWALAEDGSNNIWVGTWGGGLAKLWYDGITWSVYKYSLIPNNFITALAVDTNDNIWIGTYGPWYNDDGTYNGGGLTKFDGTSGWTTFNTDNTKFNGNPAMPLEYINSIVIDGNNIMWIGSNKNGLAQFDGTNIIMIYDPIIGLKSSYVIVIAIDNFRHNQLIGTFGIFKANSGGLAIKHGGHWVYYTSLNSGFPCNWVTSIAIDGSNNIWIGTYGGGLVMFDGTNWIPFNTSNSGLPDNWVTSIAIDGNNNIWIGTRFRGLAKFDGTNWINYNTLNSGLPDNWVTSIIIDKNKVGGEYNKWIGTYYGGLAKFNENGA